jgi:hypothetical protein
MKIAHLLDGINIALTNEEHKFVKRFPQATINTLDERDKWIAQNLVRKGIYELSNDSRSIIKKLDENNFR